MYKFLAKQGQHDQIAKLLTDRYGKPRLSKYSGPRGQGVMIALALPAGVSKRQVEQFLHLNNVPGAVSGRNRYRVFRQRGGWISLWEVANKVGYNVPFKMVIDGKFRTLMVELYDFGCECCGKYDRLVDVNGKPI